MSNNKNNKSQLEWKLDNTYIDLPELFFTKLEPKPVKNPKLYIFNGDLAKELDLNLDDVEGEDLAQVLGGNKVPKASQPIAQAYAGHQFGHFTILGDGRAILLGEHVDSKGRRFDIQLKGSGRTPYSRGGDGRAALGPMLREYIISEAMEGLGIATTRSLAVTLTGENIMRRSKLPSAILTRVASSHIRVGTFQLASSYGSLEDLKYLADYTINRHFPYIEQEKNKYLLFLKEVIKKQAELIAKWQLVGFIHGVMNTDNMAVSGETIDYGPCAFMDSYDRKTVFSSIDRNGRYAYGNQPDIGAWNLSRFGETLLPLINPNGDQAIKIVEEEIASFYNIFSEKWIEGMKAKLGITDNDYRDKEIIAELLYLMGKYRADYTNFFRELTLGDYSDMEIYGTDEFKEWESKWRVRIAKDGKSKDDIRVLMKASNPSIIPRNYRVEEALEAAEDGNKYPMEELLQALKKPYDYRPEQDKYTKLPPESRERYRTFCGT